MLDESSDSSISSVHNFLSCSVIMDAAVAPNWTAHEVHKDALESFLLARPLTTLKTTKFTANRDKTEYRRCRCKCSYRINIYFPRDESDFYQVRETDIPSDHFDVDENPDTIPKDREVCGLIDNLIQEYKFAKTLAPVALSLTYALRASKKDGFLPQSSYRIGCTTSENVSYNLGTRLVRSKKNCKASSTSMNSTTNTPLINHSHFIMALIRMIALS